MYKQITEKIKELGNQIKLVAGKVDDIGVTKQWLTEWDTKIENELSDLIKSFNQEYYIFAEEMHDDWQEKEDVWVIDPISNTFNFIHGLPHYAIVVSHLHKGEVMFGAIYDPAMNEMFVAEKGMGAFLNGERIQVSKNSKDLSILIGPSFIPGGKYVDGSIELIKKLVGYGPIRIFGSLGIQLAYVACGRVDLFAMYNKDIFPIYAGQIIVEEAGGKVSDFNCNKINHMTRGLVVSNGIVHDGAINWIK